MLNEEVPNMMRITAPVFCFVILFVGLSGCTINHQIVPPLGQLEPSKLPNVSTKQPIAIIAVYDPNAAIVEICRGGAHRYFAKADDLTDSAVKNLEAILKQKNIGVDAKAEKKLSIAVTNARCSGVPPYGLSYEATVQVRTGSGIMRTFTGTNVGGHVFGTDSHVSDAINEALLNMLHNDSIMGYLKD
jgi:hypothetical protein